MKKRSAERKSDGRGAATKRNKPVGAKAELEIQLSSPDDLTTSILRCDQPLFVLTETLICALRHGCVACAHKICSEEPLFPHSRPNVRPETCPRVAISSLEKRELIGLYPKGSTVLTVGDGDLSFSLALSKVLGAKSVVATTYESRNSIIASYPDTGKSNIEQLTLQGTELYHGVDANDLLSTLSIPTDRKFDYVVFNFPCIATEVAGEDGQSEEMSINQRLLTRFGLGAQQLINPGGFVHVSHKTKAAFKHWGVTRFVCEESDLKCLGAIVFDRCAYPGYVNRKARDRKSFPATDAVTYVFTREEAPGAMIDDSKKPTIQMGEELVGYLSRLEAESIPIVPVTKAVLHVAKQSLVQ